MPSDYNGSLYGELFESIVINAIKTEPHSIQFGKDLKFDKMDFY